MNYSEIVTTAAAPKQCLVLGGRGFIGSHLIDALLVRGHRVRCFERPHVLPLSEPPPFCLGLSSV